jgi:hypothetical protein
LALLCQVINIVVFMRIRVVLAAAGLFLSGGTMAAQNSTSSSSKGPVIEWHFVGGTSLQTLEKAATLREVWKMPETLAWRSATFELFSQRAATHFSNGKTNTELAALIKPLLEDLAEAESKFVFNGASTNDASWSLALRLPDERARLWSTNLWKLAAATELGAPQSAVKGWSAKSAKNNYGMNFTARNGWSIVSGGYSSPNEEFATSLKDKPGAAKDYVLKARVNTPVVKDIFGVPQLSGMPAMAVTVTPRGEGLRSEISLQLQDDLHIKPEKWELPSKLIREPLVGFTVVQGVRPQLEQWQLFKDLQPGRIPNQLFFWSRSIIQFSEYFAADVGNPQTVVENLVSKMQKEWNQTLAQLAAGFVEYNTNRHSVAWRGLPIILPYLRPAEGPDSRFLVGGFFPTDDPKTNPPPAELLAQLNQKNLVYYDWEITAERIHHWRPLWQLTRIVRNHPIIENSPSEKWLLAMSPKLGNTVTAGTLEGPREIKIVRQSPIGFNSLELVLLAHVVDPDTGARPSHPRSSNPPANTKRLPGSINRPVTPGTRTVTPRPARPPGAPAPQGATPPQQPKQ